ncbi:hypothetical protein C0Q70_20129 [Pomacea canaliculata]|uniref:Major facilitator superfamily (MFS) profile domain-containing protein n=1 Tax=Pomacea canaliculata TaxID=400727 RepID=A0A2T7NEN1_POMCA|nr:hypothetical protein C0Q70_20129 [Pomacea canaliculata]
MAEGGIAKIDLVLQELGPMGKFQVIQCLVFFLSYLHDAYQFFTYIFIGQAVSHTCAPPNNDSDWIIPELHGTSDNFTTVHYDKCNIIVIKNISDELMISRYPCVYGMKYDGDYYRSFVSEFDLVCEHASLPALSQTVINGGLGLGCIIVPSLSDRFGRKRLLMIAQMFMLSGGILAGLSPTYLVFLLARCITGFSAAGVGLTAVTAGIEVFPSTHRKFASGFGSTLWWSICIMSIVPWAYLLRDYSWRILQLAVCGSFSITILQLVIVNSLTYGALYLMTDILATSLYTGLFLNALVEGASCLLIVVTVDRFGRKKSLAGFHAVTGLSLIISSICFSFQELPALQIVATVFSLLGKFGVSASFNTLFMYTPEIFPTNVSVDVVLMLVMSVQSRYALWAPGALFGTSNLIALILLRFLPETMGKELPQTVEDVKPKNQALKS